ncbi:hypothetical protein [Synechococcus sp. BO 8801]|uniref:hypothetical protein n=1 Tax=Synechococcus sp. BO 8801 TaxID=169670 RepID=UPI001E4F07EC|nr:hypothetical protein [Synechococcus sp. BO 8801]
MLDLLLPITALVPPTAVLLVSQSNPYPTLVLRGILGSVSTLLLTTLGAVALLSSVALRLLPPEPEEADASQGRLGPGLRLEQTNPC